MLFQFLYCIAITICLNACKTASDNYVEYYHLIRESKQHSKENDPYKALEAFDMATKKVQYVHIGNYIYAAAEARKIDSCEIAIHYLSKAIMQGYKYEASHLTEEEFVSRFFDCAEGSQSKQDLKNSLISMLNNPDHGINPGLKETLDSLFMIDQKIRLDGYSTDYMKEVDSSNISLLMKLIEKYGFPDERLVGTHTAENIFYVLLHFDSDLDNLILKDKLDDALRQGQISPQKYAWIIDRRLAWGSDQKDPYYYQMPSRKMKDLSVEEIREIDARRYQIGLKPLSEVNIEFTSDGRMIVYEDWADN